MLNRLGARGYLVSGNSARFRQMLKEVDAMLLSPFDSQEIHDEYVLNEEHSNAEKIQYNQWLKERARAKLVTVYVGLHLSLQMTL